MFDIEKVRNDFPILKEKIYGNPLVYFDNGATTEKPKIVIDTISDLYLRLDGNVHRGVHFLSVQMTEAYENARNVMRSFINAGSTSEIIFTNGTTGSINLVASSFGEKFVHEGDEILVSEMEHHSNIVPWQLLAERKNAKIKVIPMDEKGELLLDKLDELLTHNTRIVSVTHVSNVLGTINPVKKIIAKAHAKGIPVLIDGAQAVQHSNVDVQDMDCDFYAFSGHKVYGPNGIGVLYGKEKWLEEMPPYQGGGDMVANVSFEKTTFAELPLKFEAGTSNYVGAVGMSKAIEYFLSLGMTNVNAYEKELLDYATRKLSQIEDLTIYGKSDHKISILSFLIKGIHQLDTGMILDKKGIAVRTGTHCAEPVMQHYGIDGTVRASLVFYNTKEEIDHLYETLLKVKKMFS